MVRGLDIFQKYFEGLEEQYVLIGGAACDLLFTSNAGRFRATRDLDVVLIVEALTPEFGKRFWEFIEQGQYRNKATSIGQPQFYRFDKPEIAEYPQMIELFARTDFEYKEMSDITPIHIDDEVSSLSAILLNDDYYQTLLSGRAVVNGLSVLRPEFLIIFKAKAYLDLKMRRENGESIDSRDIKKHKNDVLRLVTEFLLEPIDRLPKTVHKDMHAFIVDLEGAPYDASILQIYGLSNAEIIERLQSLYGEGQQG